MNGTPAGRCSSGSSRSAKGARTRGDACGDRSSQPLADAQTHERAARRVRRAIACSRSTGTRDPRTDRRDRPRGAAGAWGRLSDWIDEARDDIRTQRRLATAVAEWEIGRTRPELPAPRGSARPGPGLDRNHDARALHRRERGYLTRERRASARQERAAEEARRIARSTARAPLRQAGCGSWSPSSRWRRSSRRPSPLVAKPIRATRAERESRIATARELAAASMAQSRGRRRAQRAARDPGRRRRTRDVDGAVVPEAEEALHRAVPGRSHPASPSRPVEW